VTRRQLRTDARRLASLGRRGRVATRAPPGTPPEHPIFVESIALTGDVLAVGAPLESSAQPIADQPGDGQTGALYIFQ
jgi:hypothetical protein